MFRLILFLKKVSVPLVFVLLEIVSLHFYTGSSAYTRSRSIALSNGYAGWVRSAAGGVAHYFHLGRENRALTAQVARLSGELAALRVDSLTAGPPSEELSAYQYMGARVVGNTTDRQKNFITLNRGMRDYVEAGMAAISPEGGIVGYVLSCSEKFAVCISVLSRDFRTSGRVAGTDFVGSVSWDGVERDVVALSDIPRTATLHRGDTIVTSHLSSYFPPDVPVGTVEDWTLDELTYSYRVRVKLTADLSTLREVVLVRYADAAERRELEESAAQENSSGAK